MIRRAASIVSRLPGFFRHVQSVRNQRDALPRMLTYTVTFRCNARCIMCDSWKMSGEGDLTLEEIRRIVPQLPKMDAVRVTGGEPFVRTDLPEIVALVQQHIQPLWMHITTNGFLTDRIVSFCNERDKSIPLQLLISLDGVGEKHNKIRGSTLAWSSATKTLKELVPRSKELHLDLAVNQTIVDAEGVEHYKLLRDELDKLGVRHQAVMAYESSATYNLEREIDLSPKQVGKFLTFGDFRREDLERLFELMQGDISRLSWHARRAKQYYLDGIRNRLLSENATPNPPCVALQSHLRIFPNGDVPTCQFNSQTIGNLRSQTFDEVWTSQRATTQRDWVRKCVGCWAECEILPSAIYSMDLLRKSAVKRT